jgi:hypothetical protein
VWLHRLNHSTFFSGDFLKVITPEPEPYAAPSVTMLCYFYYLFYYFVLQFTLFILILRLIFVLIFYFFIHLFLILIAYLDIHYF